MPGFDRTGPRGLGPMSGRGRGLCIESGAYAGGRFGGFGRGWRHRFFNRASAGRFFGMGLARYEPDLSSNEKMEMLQSEADYFERELKNIREEIEDLKKNKNKTEDIA